MHTGTCITVPDDTEQTTTTINGNYIWSHGYQPTEPQHPTEQHNMNPTPTIETMIKENDKWTVRSLHCTDKGRHIADAIREGKDIAVCDGSYKEQFGTAGFVIQYGDSKEAWVTGAHVTPGHADDINPYSSELGGILALVAVAEAIAELYNIKDGSVELGCDCQSGITAIFEHEYDTPKQPHHDIIHETRKKLEYSRITW